MVMDEAKDGSDGDESCTGTSHVPRLGVWNRTYGLRRLGKFEKCNPRRHHKAAGHLEDSKQ